MSNAKKVSGILGILLLTVSLGVILVPGAQQSAESLYEAAVFKKDAGGDMEGAIKIFREVIDRFPNNLEIAAKAQLQIGLCYEKLGRAEAVKAYELVLEKYAGQQEQVAAARARLAELAAGTPVGPSVVELDFPAGEPYELSPDGTMMAGIEFDKGQNIVVLNLKTKELKFITDYDWSRGSFWTYNPIWSPDGKEIAFNANREGPDGKKLMKSTLDGPPRVLLSNEKYWYFPNAWMPDGSAILTIRGEYKDNTQELGFVPSEGGEFKKILSLNGNVVTSGSSVPQACMSPDGRFIVFTDFVGEGNRDIFVATADGRVSWPLVPHPAQDGLPRWSPDGKHIVFGSFRHGSAALWGVAVENGKAAGDPFLIQEGMEGTRLLNWNNNGILSWKGITIQDIYLLDVVPNTGEPRGEPRPLSFRPTGNNLLPVWSPDGKSIAFFSRDGSSEGQHIVVCGTDGGNVQKFTVPSEQWTGYLRWTPDGKGIGFICHDFELQNKIHRLDLETGQWTTILIPLKGGWSRFEWSGNGRTYFYSKNGLAEEGAGIYERDLETGGQRLIYSNQEERANFRRLKCSRDYKWLAFLEMNSKIKIVNLETGEVRPLASDIGNPTWSSDGQNLLTMQASDGNNRERVLTVVPISGGPIKRYPLSSGLPQRCRIRVQDWSPDGQHIVFQVNQGGWQILLNRSVIPEGKK